jgi:hypothetical protein
MKEIVKTIYVTFDGKEFATRAEAATWEDQHVDARLIDLSIDRVREALSYRDKDLAAAFEYAGDLCREARKAAGDLRRRPAAKGAPNVSEAAGAAADAAGGGERDLLGTEGVGDGEG